MDVDDQPVNDEPSMPYAGVKESGWGRFGAGNLATSRSDPSCGMAVIRRHHDSDSHLCCFYQLSTCYRHGCDC